MGFDAIDRQFRRKEPIKLECTDCNGTADVTMRKYYGLPDLIPLCAKCCDIRENEIWYGI